MIDALSPLSRKIIAVALLVLVIVTLLNLVVMPLWQACADGLDALAQARSRLAHMESIVTAAPPEQGDAVPGTALIVAPSRDGAVATLVGVVSASAAKVKMTPSMSPVPPATPAARLAVNIDGAGSEVDLVAFLADVESSSPAIRLQNWSLTAPDGPGAPAHVHARAVAIWGVRP